MGSSISIYLSNRYSSNYHLDICILVGEFANSYQLFDFQNELKGLINTHTSHSLYKTNTTLYFYSFHCKDVNSILDKATKYLNSVKHINLIGSDQLLGKISNYLNTFKTTNNTDHTIKHLDEHSFLQDKLHILTRLTNFCFSISSVESNEDFSPQPVEVITYDLIVVLMQPGPTYYYVPLDSTIGSPDEQTDKVHSRVGTKFIGNSPIGSKSIVSLFKQYIKNYGPFINDYYKMGDYTFDQIFELSKTGNHEMCNVLVKDIFGEWSHEVNLPPNLIASKFGKIQVPNMNRLLINELDREGVLEDVKERLFWGKDSTPLVSEKLLKEVAPKLKTFKDKIVGIEHFANSLMLIFVETIAHHAYLRSLIHNCKKILFVGEEFKNKTVCLMTKEKLDYFPGGVDCLFSEVSSVHPILGCLDIKRT